MFAEQLGSEKEQAIRSKIQYCQEITCQKPRPARRHLICVRFASAGICRCVWFASSLRLSCVRFASARVRLVFVCGCVWCSPAGASGVRLRVRLVFVCGCVWCSSAGASGVRLRVRLVFVCGCVWCSSAGASGVRLRVRLVFVCGCVWCSSAGASGVRLRVRLVFVCGCVWCSPACVLCVHFAYGVSLRLLLEFKSCFEIVCQLLNSRKCVN